MTKKRFSWEKVMLSPLQCDILKTLFKEDCPCIQQRLSTKTRGGISGVSKALTHLMSYGLVACIKQEIKAYFLNPDRKEEIRKFLTGWKLGKNKPLAFSGHAFTFEAEINGLPNELAERLRKDNSFVSQNPKNWKHFYKKPLLDGSFVLSKTKNGSKLTCYFHTFGFSPAIIEQINVEKFLHMKSDLEEEYPGLKIGRMSHIASCPWAEYAMLKDPIAQAGVKFGIKCKKIENSYRYDIAEWEEKGFNSREKVERIIALRIKENDELDKLSKRGKKDADTH